MVKRALMTTSETGIWINGIINSDATIHAWFHAD
jgi:hypothetical protein